MKDINIDEFDIVTLDDEIRVETRCSELLKTFFRELQETAEIEAQEASTMAYSVNYFLSDFVISDRKLNPFKINAKTVKQFGGHWYIVKTLEPNMKELALLLAGVDAFYKYCSEVEVLSHSTYTEIHGACSDLDFFKNRIESFWDIKGDGYNAWKNECSLDH